MWRHSYAWACVSLKEFMGYMAGLAQRRNINTPAGQQTSVTPRRTNPAVRPVYTSAPSGQSAVVHLVTSLRPVHLFGDQLLCFATTAVASACSLCQDRDFPSCLDFGSAPHAPQSGITGGATLNTCVGVEILNHCIKPPKTGRDSNNLLV